ncbi:hypothetical protein AYJ08_00330 [Brevibacillus sp. SKDU10]|uniref:BC1872 family protein n=1 Tax=Brevibacillus sp. SKDU10 TaxID=1247872 RepID=UPI0007C95B9A|nr:hypothetical protein [Brevibacillus sp. SKDU10]OAJ75230.1 hypothetical protein AYJ08_00330 [Brevibacillus sp. SKDU10]
MTEQQIIVTLATEVMGWHIDTPYWSERKVWVKSPTQYDWIESWNPLQNLDDALQLVTRFETWQVTKMRTPSGDPKYRATVKANQYTAYGETPQEAICKAAMEVVEQGDK